MTPAVADAPVVRGHVVVRRRALERVFAALAARTLGVASSAVRITASDVGGALHVDVRAPFAAAQQSVMDGARLVRTVLQDEGTQLTGARVGSVRVRITDVSRTTRRRVA